MSDLTPNLSREASDAAPLFPRQVLLEIAVDNAADAALAWRAGADRIELVADLATQGLTAPAGLVLAAKGAMPLPIVAMVRPRAGDFWYGDEEHDAALRETAAAVEAGAGGIVFGCLTSAGYIDRPKCREIIREAAGLPTVFHRAFDFAPDAGEAMEELISLGVARILTAGTGSWATGAGGEPLEVRIARVRGLIEQAAGRIEILPGGGVRPENAGAWLAGTGVWQLHSACRVPVAIPCETTSSLDGAMVGRLRAACDEFARAKSSSVLSPDRAGA